MQLKYNRKNSRHTFSILFVAAVWFLAISGGIVYAQSSAQGPYNNQAQPGIPPDAAQFADFATTLVNLLSENSGGNAANINAELQNTSDATQANALQEWIGNGYMRINNSTGNQHAQTTAAGLTEGAFLKANDASQVLYARADDLANAMTLAIINEYSKSEEENLAELYEEGKKYGYFTDADTMADNTPNHSFSLISKAFADIPKDDPAYALGDDGAGQPSDCSGMTDTYGVTVPGGMSQSPAKDQCAGRLFGAKLEYVVGLPGRPRCPPSAACVAEVIRWGDARASRGPRLNARMKNLVSNATMGSAGLGIGTPSLGIAITTARKTNSGKIASLVGSMASAANNVCMAHSKVNQLIAECRNGGGFATPRQAMFAASLGAATSIDWHAGMAAAGTLHQEQHLPLIQNSARDAGALWLGGNPALPSVKLVIP